MLSPDAYVTLDHLVEETLEGRFRGWGGWRPEASGPSGGLTPKGPLVLPGRFSGWSRSKTLAQLIRLKTAGRSDPEFFGGRYRLYRLARTGLPRPLYIGMVKEGGVFRRVCRHYFGTSTNASCPVPPSDRRRNRGYSKAAHAKLLGLPRESIEVRVGRIEGIPALRMDRHYGLKLLHAYELWLQMREKPQVYRPSVYTFDDFEELRNESMP